MQSPSFFTLYRVLLPLFHAFICFLALRTLSRRPLPPSPAPSSPSPITSPPSPLIPRVVCSLILVSSSLIITCTTLLSPIAFPYPSSSLSPAPPSSSFLIPRLLLLLPLPLTLSQVACILLFIVTALKGGGRGGGGWAVGAAVGGVLVVGDVGVAVMEVGGWWLGGAVGAWVQLVYGVLAAVLAVSVALVGGVAGRRMWQADERAERAKEEALQWTSSKPAFAAASRGVGPAASPSLHSLAGGASLMLPSLLSLPDLHLIRIDSFPSQASSVAAVEEEDGQGEGEKDPLSGKGARAGSAPLLLPIAPTWSHVARAVYRSGRLWRLTRFVGVSSLSLVLLCLLLLCHPSPASPVADITRQGVLYLTVGCLSASSIAVF